LEGPKRPYCLSDTKYRFSLMTVLDQAKHDGRHRDRFVDADIALSPAQIYQQLLLASDDIQVCD
jgi:hypothetical protein